MLKESQNLTNRAALTDASISNIPAKWLGCCATIPTEFPLNLLKPTIMFFANNSWI